MSDKLPDSNKDGFIKKLYKISVKAITLFLCGLAIYVLYSVGAFLFNWHSNGGLVQWGVLKIGGLFISMFTYVLSITLPYIFPPIIVYLLLEVFLRKLPHIMRWGAELGCTYIFYLASGWISSDSGIIKWMLLAFQVYFLFILVMPQELMGIIGCIASMAVSLIVFFLPDMPGAYDDVAAICTVIAVICGYIYTLATIIKRRVAPFLIKIFK